jgi:hypothetical protein
VNSTTRILLWLIGGLLLFMAPWFIRAIVLDYDQRAYVPPDVPAASMAATPVPTLTSVALNTPVAFAEAPFRSGPVVVDLAHLNRLNRSSFQPLAAALADRNVGLRFWLPKTELNAFDIQSFLDFPDQSDRLAVQLADASAFVVVSPFFLWSPEEIKLIEQFVADGGRLLLISDPDISGDVARDINNLAEPFGVVFNDDYLYDTAENDGNHTHIYLRNFLDPAAALAGSEIAMYGARSISGATAPLAATGESTLSSVRPGISGFTTMALAGTEARGTIGRVLVMSDFDTLTTPYVDRNDNQRLVEFVADFLADASFTPTIIDFPAYLGKEVRLLYGSEQALGAELLAEGARLQDRLAETGRTLTLADKDALNGSADGRDLIYLADFRTAETDAGLLTTLGLQLVEEAEEEAKAEAKERGQGEGAVVSEAEDGTRTPAPTFTPTATVTPLPTPTPRVTTYLETQAGLRFVADETLFVGLSETDGGAALLVLLAPNEGGISAGVERLLARDFRDCIREETRVLCPLEAEEEAATPTPTLTPTASSTEAAASTESTPTPTPAAGEGNQILLVDDNDGAVEGEVSEADLYIKGLAAQSLAPDLWQTADRGTPSLDELKAYRWVIWSGAGYAISGPGVQDLALLLEYTNTGGRFTISSRQTNLAQAPNEAAPIRDLVVDAEGQALLEDFPTEPIVLDEDLPPVYALSDTFLDTIEISVALRRGPESDYEDAPVLLYYSDKDAPDPQGAQIAVLGMALNWLPDDLQQTLVRNMAAWQLAESE